VGAPERQDDGPMTEVVEPQQDQEQDGEEVLRRLVDERPEPTLEVADALASVVAAREGMQGSLDELTSATQSALDVPAKIRKNPVKTAALVGGVGFLIAGGPRRVVRSVGRRVLPNRPDRYDGLLPDEIEQVLRDSGCARDPEVRRALNKDFADYLKQKGKYGPEPSAARSFWRTFDRVAGPLGTAGARVMVMRLMEAEHDRSAARIEARAQARERSET